MKRIEPEDYVTMKPDLVKAGYNRVADLLLLGRTPEYIAKALSIELRTVQIVQATKTVVNYLSVLVIEEQRIHAQKLRDEASEATDDEALRAPLVLPDHREIVKEYPSPIHYAIAVILLALIVGVIVAGIGAIIGALL